MDSCRDIDALMTPVADNEATAADRARVEGHLRECAPCHRQMHAEREARQLVRERAATLVGHAPLGLRARCAATRAQAAPAARRPTAPAEPGGVADGPRGDARPRRRRRGRSTAWLSTRRRPSPHSSPSIT